MPGRRSALGSIASASARASPGVRDKARYIRLGCGASQTWPFPSAVIHNHRMGCACATHQPAHRLRTGARRKATCRLAAECLRSSYLAGLLPASTSAVAKRMFGMRCPSPEWPRLVTPATRHNAPLGHSALRSTHGSGKLTRQHLFTPNRLREKPRPSDYARFTAFAGKTLISKVFMRNVVGVRAGLSGMLGYSITQNSV